MEKTFEFVAFGENRKGRFVRDKYCNDGATYIGIQYYDNEYSCWDNWDDLTINKIGCSTTNEIVVLDCEDKNIFVDILKEWGAIKDTIGETMSGFNTYKIYSLDYDKLKEVSLRY